VCIKAIHSSLSQSDLEKWANRFLFCFLSAFVQINTFPNNHRLRRKPLARRPKQVMSCLDKLHFHQKIAYYRDKSSFSPLRASGLKELRRRLDSIVTKNVLSSLGILAPFAICPLQFTKIPNDGVVPMNDNTLLNYPLEQAAFIHTLRLNYQ